MLILWFVTWMFWALGFLLVPRLRPGVRGGGPGVRRRLSVIIPARNEAHNLPVLLRSLAEQSAAPEEILVMDDGSSDGTGEVAKRFGAAVIAPGPPPEGWRGKTWACQQGARAATGDWLLFLDADTWFEPGGLARVLESYEGGAFSAGPYHAVRRPYEELSVFFNLNMAAGVVPNGLFGQMLLVDRDSYERVGGHAAARGRILENLSLAGSFRDAGIPVRSATGRGVFSFRMYPNGMREMIEGWTKAFAAGAGQTPRGVLLLVIGWMIGLTIAPTGWCWTGGELEWGLVYGCCAAQVGWLSRFAGRFRIGTALLYPVALMFFFAVFGLSALRSGKSVTWKGREIPGD